MLRLFFIAILNGQLRVLTWIKMAKDISSNPIGIFDSGVGGLSVLRAIRNLLPNESMVFLADQANVPYGPRSLDQVRQFSESITRFLLSQKAKIIVVACNTASAAALAHLRLTFPQISFVGMEPAVKPAAELSQTRVVGVLATPATFQGALYASVVERFAQGVTVLQHTCPGLVNQIEAGNLDSYEARRILEDALHPMIDQGIDTVVLGCTHYPFVIPLIEEIVGPEVRVIDPAPAVARQVERVLQAQNNINNANQPGSVTYITTGHPDNLDKLLPILIGENTAVIQAFWKTDCGNNAVSFML